MIKGSLKCNIAAVKSNVRLLYQEEDGLDSDSASRQPSEDAADNPVENAVAVKKKSDTTLCGAVEDDLSLVAYMYGLLFQCYADKVGKVYLTFYLCRACLGILPSSRSFPVLEDEEEQKKVVFFFLCLIQNFHMSCQFRAAVSNTTKFPLHQ